MPLADEERDKQFERDVQAGLSITQLAKKYGIGKRQVSRLKAKFRKKELPLKVTSTSTVTSASLRRVTFWVNGEMIDKIKSLASKQGRTASALVREIFNQYLKRGT